MLYAQTVPVLAIGCFFWVTPKSFWQTLITFLAYTYLLALQDAPGSSCIYFWPTPMLNHFFKESWFLLTEDVLETKIWVLVMLIAPGLCCF